VLKQINIFLKKNKELEYWNSGVMEEWNVRMIECEND